MPDGCRGGDLVLVQGGRQALDILTANDAGRVAALFEHSFYIAFDKKWVCLGAGCLPMGPLNVRTSAPDGVVWASCGLHIDEPVLSSSGSLWVGQALEFSVGDVVPWTPPAPPPWTALTVKAGLDGLNRLVVMAADEGLAGFVLGDPARVARNRVTAAARQPIDVLSRAVECAFRELPLKISDTEEAVIDLLGLGPGLTPSGDDFLGGMLIALAILPVPTLRAHLQDVIEGQARQRTNAVSFAHLRAAGSGEGHEALHEIFNSLLGGKMSALPVHVGAINTIGHSSGWDALAGMCVTLRAYLAAQRVAVPIHA
ncbi:MAG: DUF2877 domain-containing protein [Proteobacteria bacterium]|nr:DUF2877 domain-containing protein [Pseudomonadota bacterium]